MKTVRWHACPILKSLPKNMILRLPQLPTLWPIVCGRMFSFTGRHEARIPTHHAGEFEAIVYKNDVDLMEHIALVKGELAADSKVLVQGSFGMLNG